MCFDAPSRALHLTHRTARLLLPGLLGVLFSFQTASAFGPSFILERYELDELVLSGLRWKQGKLQFCFKLPSGAYVTTFLDGYVGKNFGQIKQVNRSSQVVVREVVETEDGDWIERKTLIERSPQTRCDWKNSIANRQFLQDFSRWRQK
jgi:hypothetical protein